MQFIAVLLLEQMTLTLSIPSSSIAQFEAARVSRKRGCPTWWEYLSTDIMEISIQYFGYDYIA